MENFDFLKMLGDNFEETLQEYQYDRFVEMFYIDKNMKKFFEEINKLGTEESPTTNMINDREPTEFENKVINMIGKATILSKVMKTKKIMDKPKDFMLLAELFDKMANDCREISTMKNKKGHK